MTISIDNLNDQISGNGWSLSNDLTTIKHVGTYFHAAGTVGHIGTTGTTTTVVGTIYALPFVVARTCTVDALAASYSGSPSGAISRLGIYQATSQTNIYPNALVVSSAQYAPSQGTYFIGQTVSAVLKAGVLYWLALNEGDVGNTVRTIPVANMYPIYGQSAAGASGVGLAIAGQSGATLASTFPGGATVQSVDMPLLAYRLSA